MKRNVELLDMCMCIVFAFQLIRAKEVRIDIEVKRSEEKLHEVTPCLLLKFLYSLVNIFVCTVFAFQLIIEVRVRSEEK